MGVHSIPEADHIDVLFRLIQVDKGCAEKSALLEPLFRQTAADNHCRYLNTYEIPGVEMAPYDHMHLSMSAHAALADKLSELVPELCVQ